MLSGADPEMSLASPQPDVDVVIGGQQPLTDLLAAPRHVAARPMPARTPL